MTCNKITFKHTSIVLGVPSETFLMELGPFVLGPFGNGQRHVSEKKSMNFIPGHPWLTMLKMGNCAELKTLDMPV